MLEMNYVLFIILGKLTALVATKYHLSNTPCLLIFMNVRSVVKYILEETR